MSFIQRFFMKVLPRSWAESMRADSLRWTMRCTCGFEQSIWEMGGIRWKATGNSRNLLRCRQCGRRTWHRLYWKADS